MSFQIEHILFAVAILFFLSLLAGKAGSRLGVPALLLFLLVGMLAGSDGMGIHFENFQFAQSIGTVALCIILFSGGLDTKKAEIHPVMARGIILATVGVLLTAILSGLIIWWILGMTIQVACISILSAMLLAAIMSSTDSASVFSILRSKGLSLKNNLRPLLELESGSNDPMAYVLVITLIELITMGSEPNYLQAGLNLVLQLVIGGLIGFALGKFAVFIINRIKIDNISLYPILVFTFCIFIFSSSYLLRGNAYLAVYIAGLVIGNSKFVHKRSSLNFFDGLAWISQLIMFLTLGLLVNPRELIAIIVPGLMISFLLIFISRPLTVFLCLAPFRKMTVKDKTFVSWVGLRGAVPIIFAIFPLAADIPNARFIFNIVFFCTLVSLLLQGTTLAQMAKWLGLAEKPKNFRKSETFDVDFSDEIKSATCEITVKPETLLKGSYLMDLNLPDQTLVVMIKRNDKYFVPTGKTLLMAGDKLLVITDNHEAMQETYRNLGIDKVSK